MSRTNIDIDDELVTKVMEQNGLKTKKAAVDFALRKAVRRVPSASEILALEGIGFEYTNDEVAAMSPPRDLW
jgi:Arc/MetJ family transcription regulator